MLNMESVNVAQILCNLMGPTVHIAGTTYQERKCKIESDMSTASDADETDQESDYMEGRGSSGSPSGCDSPCGLVITPTLDCVGGNVEERITRLKEENTELRAKVEQLRKKLAEGVREVRVPNACKDHRLKHQKCPPECANRKKPKKCRSKPY